MSSTERTKEFSHIPLHTYEKTLASMVSVICHEIKNPLTSVDIQIQLLKERLEKIDTGQHQNKLTQSTDLISKEIRRLLNFLDDYLRFTHPSKLDYQICDLQQVIIRFIDFISPDAEKQNIQIRSHFSDQPILIKCDIDKMHQVLLNLILNSFQAMDNNGIINISIDLDKRENMVVCDLSDTGKGISKENFKDIFKPFFTFKTGGTGLGLSIARQIIKDHNGDMRVLKSSKSGTTIRFRLPLQETIVSKYQIKELNG